MTIEIKPGVILPPLLLICLVVSEVMAMYAVQCVLTSGRDGTHMKGSLHYVDRALDFRTRDLQPHQRMQLAQRVQDRLGNDYDVVLEESHLHVEHDPKGEPR